MNFAGIGYGHALMERRPEEALIRLGQPSLTTYVPYFLLPYGSSLDILEPDKLVGRMVEVSMKVAKHYEEMIMNLDEAKGRRMT